MLQIFHQNTFDIKHGLSLTSYTFRWGYTKLVVLDLTLFEMSCLGSKEVIYLSSFSPTSSKNV